MKNRSIWKWALCGLGILLLFGAASHYFWHWNWNGPSGFGSRSFGHGPGGDMLPHKLRGGFGRGGITGGHGGGAGFGSHPLLSLLLPIGLMVGGMLLWRNAKENFFLRVTGMVMTAAGVLILTPPVIGIVILIAAAYFYYRTRKQPQSWGSPSVGQASPAIIPVEPMYTENPDNAQILDAWEQNTLKEDK